jgi:hypothetical protein
MLLCVPICENNALFALLTSLCGILQYDYSIVFTFFAVPLSERLQKKIV